MSGFFLTVPGLLDELKPEILAIATKAPEQFQALGHAVGTTAYDASELYDEYLKGHPIPGRGQLKKPLQGAGKVICRPMAALVWAIGHEDGDAAKRIEEGTPERDMKLDLPTSRKARQGKHGLYLIIPFRHGTPTARGIQSMPKEVYKLAKAMSFSHHLGQVGTRVSATGHTVPVYGYQWGDKLPSGTAGKMKAHHQGDIYAQMYRFKDAGTTKASKSAGYITFRTMSQGSPARSWIRPGQPGLHPLDTAMEEAWKANLDALNGALLEDCTAMVAGFKS